MERKYGYIAQGVLVVVLAVLLGVGSVYDTLIAEKLFTGDVFITNVAEIFGKMPLFLAATLACGVAFHTASRTESKGGKAWYYIRKAVYCLGGVACGAFMFKDLFDMVTSSTLISLAMCGMAGIALFTVISLFLPRMNREKLFSWKKWAIATITAAAVIVIITEAVKLGWGRARPFEVAKGAQFTAWYTISAYEGESFFSGHASCCMGLLMFTPLLWIDDDEPIYRIMYFVLAAVFIMCTMLCRIMSGAHYLTDVAAGAIISVIVMAVTYGVAFRNGYAVKPQGFIDKYL